MKPLLILGIAAIFSTSLAVSSVAQTTETPPAWDTVFAPDGENLNDFLWAARPVVVFADSPEDPRFAQQMALLEAQARALKDRDVVVLTDTDPSKRSALRTSLRPRGFMMVLIGKDGGVKLRKASPWNVRELTRVIDKTSERQREVEERR